MFATLASYGYLAGVQDLRVDSDVDTSTALWQLPRVRVGLGTTARVLRALVPRSARLSLASRCPWVYSRPDE